MGVKFNPFKKSLFILIQCSFGLAQTFLGLVIFLIFIRKPHRFYRGCIDTRWNSSAGLSLGLFIFTPDESFSDSQKTRVHEYGHCIQSLVLGPIYLFLIGIVSAIWAGLPYFEKLRIEKGVPYTACFVESWASRWGERVTGEAAFWG